ncbi:hypothetical protein RMSM_07107 [Rhodopirellula maiorica SM1]|uniref:Uncharacterized protein n=1 Tax=Rhodopirellula maiorica SM1 TaxID=1265738 RepID=M5RAA2_9BACT|nr:hypothetical protein [Rhodopirellula maiorica]EMI15991.1 hypothetical protein RMSM_07107 [Rhodopirellula maiorica SM1]
MTSAIKQFHVYLYGPERGALQTSFEEAATRLQLLPQLYFELDGSFVWSADQGQQIEGMLYDANEQLQYVDLQGRCTQATWHAVLHAIVGSSAVDCIVMVIPARSLKNLPTFEQSIWGD